MKTNNKHIKCIVSNCIVLIKNIRLKMDGEVVYTKGSGF